MIEIDVFKQLGDEHKSMQLKVQLTIDKGDFLAIAGESGSGKTTFLRILAGLEEASGKIIVNGKTWLDGKINMQVQKRDIGFVFQEYALFDNMSVMENLLYVKKDKELANRLLEMSGLEKFAMRKPRTLSGGQKQRVSLCRAMMKKPVLLLMDEPLSALDVTMRKKLQNEIAMLHKEFDTTTIMVSHDPSEIYKLANKMVVLHDGKVQKFATPKEVLLKTQGSQKFSFEGEILEIVQVDVIFVAIISIGQQLVEVVVSNSEAQNLHIGQKVTVSTKAFAPIIR